jgi:hypothetical protein
MITCKFCKVAFRKWWRGSDGKAHTGFAALRSSLRQRTRRRVRRDDGEVRSGGTEQASERGARVIVFPRQRMTEIPEAMIQKIVLAQVNRIPGVRLWRMNTGKARMP